MNKLGFFFKALSEKGRVKKSRVVKAVKSLSNVLQQPFL